MARKQGTLAPDAPAAKAGAGQHSVASVASRPGKLRRQEIGHELRAAASEPGPEEIGDAVFAVRFGLTEGIAYHASREQYLARLNRWLTGLQVFLGTSAIAALTDIVPFGPTIPLIISSLAGVILLVIDPAAGAREHRALRSRLHHSLADLEDTGDSATVKRCRAEIHRAAADAPPAYRGAQALAYNTAVMAFYPAEDARPLCYRVGRVRRMLAHWAPMRGHQFERGG